MINGTIRRRGDYSRELLLVNLFHSAVRMSNKQIYTTVRYRSDNVIGLIDVVRATTAATKRITTVLLLLIRRRQSSSQTIF